MTLTAALNEATNDQRHEFAALLQSLHEQPSSILPGTMSPRMVKSTVMKRMSSIARTSFSGNKAPSNAPSNVSIQPILSPMQRACLADLSAGSPKEPARRGSLAERYNAHSARTSVLDPKLTDRDNALFVAHVDKNDVVHKF
jgi:hypothetical protein